MREVRGGERGLAMMELHVLLSLSPTTTRAEEGKEGGKGEEGREGEGEEGREGEGEGRRVTCLFHIMSPVIKFMSN